ncbi:MAG: inorganic diphosphatase [Candidatus Aenigmatarchaeota archaeon]
MDISKLEPGTKDLVNVFVESEKGSKSYYKYDQKTGFFNLEKVLKLPFTGSFGFVPKTHHVDANTLDVMILASDSIKQGIVVQARPIGIVRLKAQIPDDVLIAVSIADKEYEKLKDISEVDDDTVKNLKAFLEEFKELKVENVLDSVHAKNSVRRSMELYQRSVNR